MNWYQEAKLLKKSGLELFFRREYSRASLCDYIILYAGKNRNDNNPTEIKWWKEYECPFDFDWIEKL
jgi:hypothetical protein